MLAHGAPDGDSQGHDARHPTHRSGHTRDRNFIRAIGRNEKPNIHPPGGDHHNGVPIFVPTHQPPAENPFEQVHYVTDGIAACVQQAKAAAGDRDVFMHGAYTAQECLKAGVLDVLEIQLRPVLLGQGRRLFDGLPSEHIELDLVRTLEAPATLHLRYEVRHL